VSWDGAAIGRRCGLSFQVFYRGDGSHVGGTDHQQPSRLNVDGGKAYAWGGFNFCPLFLYVMAGCILDLRCYSKIESIHLELLMS